MDEQQTYRLFNGAVFNKDKVIEIFFHYGLGIGKRNTGGQAFGNGLHCSLNRLPLFPAHALGRGLGRLNTDNLDFRVDGFGDNSGAANAAAGADRHDDHINLGQLFHNFQAIGADPMDKGFIGRADKGASPFLGYLGNPLSGAVKIRAMKNDLCPQPPHGGNLAGIGAFGYGYCGLNAMGAGGKGDGLTVIARGGREQAPLFLLFRQTGHKVEPAANLESAHRLVVFMFKKNPAADKVA